jgi:hypothetical protein
MLVAQTMVANPDRISRQLAELLPPEYIAELCKVEIQHRISQLATAAPLPAPICELDRKVIAQIQQAREKINDGDLLKQLKNFEAQDDIYKNIPHIQMFHDIQREFACTGTTIYYEPDKIYPDEVKEQVFKWLNKDMKVTISKPITKENKRVVYEMKHVTHLLNSQDFLAIINRQS